MKLQETFHFDEDHYRQNISDKHFSYTDLAKEIYRKRANGTTSKTRAFMGVIAAPFTGGMSGITVAMNCRNISVEARKLKLLELEWARRGQTRLPIRTITDQLIPVTIAVGTNLISFGIDIGISGIAPSPDIFYQPAPTFDLNGHLISEALTELEGQGPTLLKTGLDQVVNTLGDKLTSQIVTSDPPDAQHTSSA